MLRPLTAGVISVRTALVASVVALTVVIALAGAVAVQARTAIADAAAADRRAELRDSAGTIVAEVFTVRDASWRADRDRARSRVTPEFAAAYASELSRPPQPGTRATQWTPRTVALGDVRGHTGVALIVVSVVTTPDTAPPRTEDRTVSARFRSENGDWLLDGVDVIG